MLKKEVCWNKWFIWTEEVLATLWDSVLKVLEFICSLKIIVYQLTSLSEPVQFAINNVVVTRAARTLLSHNRGQEYCIVT